MNRRAREVLEVVEVEQRAGALEPIADRVHEGLTPRLAHPECTRDRARNEVVIGDRREPDEVHGSLERRAGRDLEREPALSCAARPGDGDESRTLLVEEALDARERVLAADEAMVERRKARGRERLERRKVLP